MEGDMMSKYLYKKTRKNEAGMSHGCRAHESHNSQNLFQRVTYSVGGANCCETYVNSNNDFKMIFARQFDACLSARISASARVAASASVALNDGILLPGKWILPRAMEAIQLSN